MRIRLSDDRRARVLAALKRHFDQEFDEPISDFRATGSWTYACESWDHPSTTSEAFASLSSV